MLLRMAQTIVVMEARRPSEFASHVYFMGMRSYCEVSCVCNADPKVCNGTGTRYFIVHCGLNPRNS